MIEKLTLDEESLKQWKDEKDREEVRKLCGCVEISDNEEKIIIPAYWCDDLWVNTLKVFKEHKSLTKIQDCFIYGYCDTEDALVKYLKEYYDDPDNSYFVTVSTMSMDYEKYYKNGTYVNKDGVNTHQDYFDYIDEHPEMKVEQDIEGKWIHYCIRKFND